MHLFSEACCPIRVGRASDQWWSEAPANIALIKYMGQAPNTEKQAINPSLSLTLLDHRVRVELTPSHQWVWQPLSTWGQHSTLTEAQQQRFLAHAQGLMLEFGLKGSFCIRSSSNFPPMCGLASSAASFAALTAVLVAVAEGQNCLGPQHTLTTVAALSQKGSGSSCRSFFKPWVVWDGTVSCIEGPVCLHQCVVVSDQIKSVSSSEAHQRVQSSALYVGRAQRARDRYHALQKAFVLNDWASSYELIWQEFWDMHALFHTAYPAFQYIAPETLWVLHQIQAHWQKMKDGPWVTLDAGANVHCVYRQDQSELRDQFAAHFRARFQVI
jgi:diphosphomevalonate decarboxylase